MSDQNSLHVLIADDSAVNYAVAAGFLQKWGHSVRHAQTGREAIRFYQEEPFDLILMDVQMPDVDGFAATARIRDIEAATGGYIPIVAMTARALPGDRAFCLAAGMDDYLSKPLDKEKLSAVLAAISSSRRIANQSGSL